jgi:hypothetical protein
MSEAAFAQHIISSIRNELNLLKTHNYIQHHAYDEILKLLPANINNRDVPSMGSYPPAFNNLPFTGGMPTPSPIQSNNSTPAAPTAAIPPPAYDATPNDNKLGSAEALYDYTGDNSNNDLSFRRGDIVQLTELGNVLELDISLFSNLSFSDNSCLKIVNSDWWKGSLYGKTGIFPRTYVKRIE